MKSRRFATRSLKNEKDGVVKAQLPYSNRTEVTDLQHLECFIDYPAQNRILGGAAQADAYISSVA
ncbi:hypothetical protein HDF12_002121 [Edaphobacter lichenicola]|uniref:Uncharacterized protein n=2 Tax=Tunturiibacter TaxID=3154218 RepID=A0A7Y9NLT7_9BACT|nr:hypothetical protein [Edaphobacter lichenicola]NYF51756.1 hypothetical protein [Edaphobacter lichenicola]